MTALCGIPFRKMNGLGNEFVVLDGRRDAIAMSAAQARAIATGVAAQGGPEGLTDKEITALVAYLQRMGTDYRE